MKKIIVDLSTNKVSKVDLTAEEEAERTSQIKENENLAKIAKDKRDKEIIDRDNANKKLKDLGLTDDEIKAFRKG